MQISSTMNHSAKHLKEIGFEMKLLLVEDDLDLQEQIKIFLSRFFGRVDTANNGVEALLRYNEHHYDLILTDLTMPIMGGTELSKKIHEINNSQRIIVLSAHSESENLIELINIGIDSFLLKPVDMERVIQQLNKTCQAIYDHKMLEYFSNMLEETNKELRDSNIELECALNELMRSKNNTLAEARVLSNNENMMLYEHTDKMSAEQFHIVHPLELDQTNENLEELEDKFNMLLMSAEHNITQETLIALTTILRDFVREIEMISQFEPLLYAIQHLQKTFESVDNPAKLSAILPVIVSLFDNLEQWRLGIFYYRNVDDIHYMDNLIISDAMSLREILDNNYVVCESDIELF